jgi:predicted nucleotidyltransferase
MKYKSFISPKMQAVAEVLTDTFVGMDHCVSDKSPNLIVEVPRNMCETVRSALKLRFRDVALMRNAWPMIGDLHDFILIKPLISESPVYEEDGVIVPELEKLLVDQDADREYAEMADDEIQRVFQRAFELYPVNTSRLFRYAGRKGKKEEISRRVERLDRSRVAIVHAIQDFFCQEPVERAWLFGSFSRMEEKPESDIDILIDLDGSVPMGLLQYAGMVNKLERLLGRKVDLVATGSVKPFAQDSINRDKVLVYERT